MATYVKCQQTLELTQKRIQGTNRNFRFALLFLKFAVDIFQGRPSKNEVPCLKRRGIELKEINDPNILLHLHLPREHRYL